MALKIQIDPIVHSESERERDGATFWSICYCSRRQSANPPSPLPTLVALFLSSKEEKYWAILLYYYSDSSSLALLNSASLKYH